jgi:hypothetical protein
VLGKVELLSEVRIIPFPFEIAGVAELADALDSKSSGRKAVWVRAPPPAVAVRCWALAFDVCRREFVVCRNRDREMSRLRST